MSCSDSKWNVSTVKSRNGRFCFKIQQVLESRPKITGYNLILLNDTIVDNQATVLILILELHGRNTSNKTFLGLITIDGMSANTNASFRLTGSSCFSLVHGMSILVL